jgi:hypothetical protein
MKTGLIISVFLLELFISGCGSTSKLSENRTLLKEYAYCKCFEYSSNDTTFFRTDISLMVYKEIAHYDLKAFQIIDSLSKKAASEIKPSQIADYENKKAILSDCFLFFKSKSLDSVIRSLDKLSLKSW